MLRRALIAAALLALVLPAAAPAATVTRTAPTIRYDATAGIRDLLNITFPVAGTIRFDTSNIGDTLVSVGCSPPSGSHIDCASAGITRVIVELGDGQDELNFSAAAIPLAMTVDGGTGTDGIRGSSLADILRGEDDGDFITGRGGADDILGGPGFDTARFLGLGAVKVSLDDIANDGQFGGAEAANVHTDVENLSGTDGGDTLTGSGAANELDGGDGNDTLDGGGGLDFYTLGDGNDTALARDGLGERVVCGEGNDTVTGDDIDNLGGCENAALSGELVRDLDHDGIAKPEDCNDADPAIRPGAVDAPNDGSDQDCDGADAVDRDRDRDGVAIPFDCDDGNARAAPGKREIYGNKVDEDCNGRADPLQTITTPVRARFIAAPGAARIVRLQVLGATKGTRVQVRCKRGGCPFKRRTLRLKRTTRKLDLRKRYGLRRIGSQTIEIRLLRSDSIGRVVRFIGKGGGIPSTRILCLAPGKKRPGSC